MKLPVYEALLKQNSDNHMAKMGIFQCMYEDDDITSEQFNQLAKDEPAVKVEK